MNRETNQILDFIDKSGYYLQKVKDLRAKHNNIRDFRVMLGYVVMEIVSENKQFLHLKRDKIELHEMSERYF